MNYPSINIQGSIISSEVIDKIRNDDDFKHQGAAAFGFERNIKVRDEIGLAWSTARSFWQAFSVKRERLEESGKGTSETRNQWVLPLLSTFGYELDIARAEIVNDKSLAISHRAANLQGFPVHIMGINDSLDKRRETGGPKFSPHSLVQEYINSTEHVYGIVCNGRYLRLLRDATRLVRLSYLEFNLEKMMEEELYADFAVLFRLLHATRMPKQPDLAAESYIEYYHQESLASGSRIREKLSQAVEQSIKELANGFLKHPENEVKIKREVAVGDSGEKKVEAISLKDKTMEPDDYYLYQLRLIYRLLFLIVTEERNLVYPDTKDEALQRKRKIYYDFYSIEHLRKLAAKAQYVDGRKHDLWEGLNATFMLFEKSFYGEKLGIKPLGSGLFSPSALGELVNLKLDNATLLRIIRHLTLFRNDQMQWVRVNYSDLDVEEFGSVYEGLLEYDATFISLGGRPEFAFVEGTGRSSSGSHYTPEELVKPLIKHSLEYIIEDKLKLPNKEAALLSIKVCDVACGSGHILLSAARRIATELARVRTNEDQPTPSAMRSAIRDVIKNCIYGVDKNPLAVELCKVALWLEAHNPGEPLNFLDHHIKNGDAIVGLAHKEELQRGIADEAFKALPGDDKAIASAYAKRNKAERAMRGQAAFDFESNVSKGLDNVLEAFQTFSKLPENTPEQIETKASAYNKLIHSGGLQRLKTLADLQIAQFFTPKTTANKDYLVTDANYFQFLKGAKAIPTIVEAQTIALTAEKRLFHWFLEFPEVFQQSGFDCIIGNPPFLGGQMLSGNYGYDYLNYLRFNFNPLGAEDLVTYFFRKIFEIIKPEKSFQSLISTNTIAEGKAREGCLDFIVNNGGEINFAIKSMKWPGLANVNVSLITVNKKGNVPEIILNNKVVDRITSYLDNSESALAPYELKQNQSKGFQGSIVLGKGFVIEPNEAKTLLDKDPVYKDVLFEYLIGDDLNNNFDQSPSRWVINFFDWNEKKAKDYYDAYKIILEKVKPQREEIISEKESKGKELGVHDSRSVEEWWKYLWPRPELYSTIRNLKRVLVQTRVSKTHAFAFAPSDYIFSDATLVFALDDYKSFAILQSSFHEAWAWKNSSTMKGDRRYSVSGCFATFPFPKKTLNEEYGKCLYHHREFLTKGIKIGLTKLSNLFHFKDLRLGAPSEFILEDKAFEKLVGKEGGQLRKHLAKTPGTISFNEAVAGIIKFRELHVQMDEAVLEAYGWSDIQLRHNFYEVDYLPENDRIRYTIHPDARKEVLQRLLELNHQIHEEEVKTGLWDKKGGSTEKAAAKAKAATAKKLENQPDLFTVTTPLFAQTVNNKVKEGSKVTLGLTGGQKMKYAILPNAQKDTLTKDGYRQILPSSALAQKLLGKKLGEKVVFGDKIYDLLDLV